MWHLLKPLSGVCQQWFGLLTPVLTLLQTLSRLHCCADRAAPARDSDDGCLHNSQVCSLYTKDNPIIFALHYRCETGRSKRVLYIHTIWITYSSYRYGPWRVVINAYFSSDLVQFDRGGTTQNLGRIVPEVGADLPRLGQIDSGRIESGADRL